MPLSTDRLAEALEHSVKLGILEEYLSHHLEKDQNSRVELLVARGLQIVRTLACATHGRQIQAANKFFIAEMNELCKTKPNTEGSQQAKATFLHFAQCSAYVISLSRCPAFQRMAWRSLLNLHERDICRWELDLERIDYYPHWWTLLETSDNPSPCATSCAHCVPASNIPGPSERSTTSASHPAISDHSAQHSETVGVPTQSTTIPPRMRGSNLAQAVRNSEAAATLVDPHPEMSNPISDAVIDQTTCVQGSLAQPEELSRAAEKRVTQAKGDETDNSTDRSGSLKDGNASLLTMSSADTGEDDSRAQHHNRPDILPAPTQLELQQDHDAIQGAARESLTPVSLQQFNDGMKALFVRLDSHYRAAEARRTAQTIDIMTQISRLSQQISRLESANDSQGMER
ncbi:hypothetical protein PENSPDRAFT_753818 [Peniophora sp. CONT]|nr:hypothetical protein PENSPDRAFT_753818 [Peniophora sp. CONT]